MGKRIIQQRRGHGSRTYLSPSFRFKGEIKHPSIQALGTVSELVHCGGHTAPLMELSLGSGEKHLAFAPEGIRVGESVSLGDASDVKFGELKPGNVLPLSQIPEGTLVHNIELRPGDGGKLVRVSGSSAKVIAKTEKDARILLPSKKEKLFSLNCRAAIGIIAGSGRTEKPFLKAGTRHKRMLVRNRLYPKVCGISMNAVDHPFGGKCSHIKGRPTQSPRNAPPGRKVGKIAPRRTGRRR